jgi:hypothetical protein
MKNIYYIGYPLIGANEKKEVIESINNMDR